MTAPGLYLVVAGSWLPVTTEILAAWIATERWEPTDMDRDIAVEILGKAQAEEVRGRREMERHDGLYLSANGREIRVTQEMMENWLAVRPGQPTTLDRYIAEDILVAVQRDIKGRRRAAQQEARP